MGNKRAKIFFERKEKSIRRNMMLRESLKYTVIGTWITVLLLSSVTTVVQFPSNYFSDVNNWLNQTMVKWAWGWTLYSLLPFAIILSCCSEDAKFNSIRVGIKIGLLGTAVWYIGTQITFRIGDLTGQCLDGNSSVITGYTTRRQCRSVMGLWDSFDISGHTFLLTWCLYVSIGQLELFATFLGSTHSFFTESVVFVIFGWNVVLNLLWCVMLAMTQLFFHSLVEKILAKCMVDAFLFSYIRLGRQIDLLLPQQKAKRV